MTCQQARNILAALFIPEDRLEALEYVKRYTYLNKKKLIWIYTCGLYNRAINDANTQEGLDYIVSCFTFEDHKLVAAQIISSVRDCQFFF